MDVNNYMNTIAGHESLQKQLESLITKDKQSDTVLRNSLINEKDSLQKQIQKLEADYREQTLLEKQLFEKQKLRDLTNLQQVDKRSTYTKFK